MALSRKCAWLIAFTKSSQKNQHSPLDTANNRCYITLRTKERRSIRRDSPKGSFILMNQNSSFCNHNNKT